MTWRTRRPAGTAFALAAIAGASVVVAAGLVWTGTAGTSPARGDGGGGTDVEGLAILLPLLTFVGVGVLLAARLPRNPVGWALAVYGLSFSTTVLLEDHTARGATVTLPLTELAAWFQTWGWAHSLLLLAMVLLHFPDGELPSPRWRWVRRGAGATALIVGVAMADLWRIRTALAVADDPSSYPPLAKLVELAQPLPLLVVLASFTSLGVRYRRASVLQRLQLRWLFSAVGGLVLGLCGFLLSGGGPSGAPPAVRLFVLLTMAGIPVSIGIAVLRYRLWDIDRIISRTLGYALVSSVLAGVYVGAVLGLGALLPGGDSDLAVAGATLAVAALFVPVRQRIQAAVDRRFHRARYDAHRTVEAFAGQLRNELDPGAIRGELVRAVRGTVPARTTTVWVRDAGSGP